MEDICMIPYALPQVCTGHGAKVGQKAASLGWMLPRTLSEADIHALGGLIPEEARLVSSFVALCACSYNSSRIIA